MKTTQNYENLKVELKNSGNVKSVTTKNRRELKDWKDEITFKVRFTKDGYSFELLQDKYPTLEVKDIAGYKDGEVSAIMTVEEVTGLSNPEQEESGDTDE